LHFKFAGQAESKALSWRFSMQEDGILSLMDLMKDKIEKQMTAWGQQLEAAEAEARSRKAQAEAEIAGAELEEELLGRVNDLKEKIGQGQEYLKELADKGENKAEDMKAKVANFFN
jgi:DNA anti-recombination protein RmuC